MKKIQWALPLIVYVLAAAGITWPLVTRINTRAAGAGYGDSYEVIRHAWWAREALLHGHNPFNQTLLAYPHGFMSWVQWAHPVQYLATAALALIVPPLAAFNLAVLITLVLNGLSAYWLGLALNGRRPLAALLGGLVFMAFPTIQGHLSAGHLGILSAYPLPLFTLCLWRITHEQAGWRTVVWGAIWFALTALSNIAQLVFVLFPLLLFFGLYNLKHLLRRDRTISAGGHDGMLRAYNNTLRAYGNTPLLRVLGMILLGGILLLPFYLPLLTAAGRAEVNAVAETGRVSYSTDLLAFASPSPFGPLKKLAPDYTRDVLGVNSIEGSAYLGVIAVALAALALIRRPAARVWGVVALGAMLFSLGPLLKWRDQPVTVRIEDYRSYVTLPWAALEQLPGLDATRTPGRFNLVTGLALSALVSLGAAVVDERLRRRDVRIGLAVILGGLILVEYQLFWPFPTDDARQPAYFRRLAQADDVRAVLNVPVDNNTVAKVSLYQQTIHHKPLIAGHALRRSPQNPAVLAILDQAATADDPSIRRQDVAYLLSAAGADRVIVHKQFVPDAGQVVERLRSILGEPEYQDDRIAAFVVPRTPDPPPDLALVSVIGAGEWSEPVNVGTFTGRFLGESGRWYLYSAAEQYGDLVFQAAPYRAPRRIGVWLDDHLIGGIVIGEGTIRLPLWLTPGFHTLRFEAPDGCTEYPFALTCWQSPDLTGQCTPLDPPACISVVLESPTWVPAGELPTPLAVQLADGVSLWAYEMTVSDRALNVRLFWQADRPLPESYALFVHLADPVSGQPLAQFDGFPVIPTDHWKSGTRWQSDVQIALPDNLPAGTYAVNVGWFHPADGARLGVRGDRPWASAGMVYLGTVEIGP